MSGFYDVKQAAYEQIRGVGIGQDMEDVLAAINAVEEFLGISLTTWNTAVAPKPTSHFAPHMMVKVGGTTPGYLRDAVDRCRSLGGAPPFPWETVPSAEDWAARPIGDKCRINLCHVVELKQAIGRVGSATAKHKKYIAQSPAPGVGGMAVLYAKSEAEASSEKSLYSEYRVTLSGSVANPCDDSNYTVTSDGWLDEGVVQGEIEDPTLTEEVGYLFRVLELGGQLSTEALEAAHPGSWTDVSLAGPEPSLSLGYFDLGANHQTHAAAHHVCQVAGINIEHAEHQGCPGDPLHPEEYPLLVVKGGVPTSPTLDTCVMQDYGSTTVTEDQPTASWRSSDSEPMSLADLLGGTPGLAGRYVWSLTDPTPSEWAERVKQVGEDEDAKFNEARACLDAVTFDTSRDLADPSAYHDVGNAAYASWGDGPFGFNVGAYGRSEMSVLHLREALGLAGFEMSGSLVRKVWRYWLEPHLETAVPAT
ncbi:MAG: hypothetical protein GHCLOJNM_01561 [bacterium]|nr:hypothetical protein [bacterium]